MQSDFTKISSILSTGKLICFHSFLCQIFVEICPSTLVTTHYICRLVDTRSNNRIFRDVLRIFLKNKGMFANCSSQYSEIEKWICRATREFSRTGCLFARGTFFCRHAVGNNPTLLRQTFGGVSRTTFVASRYICCLMGSRP